MIGPDSWMDTLVDITLSPPFWLGFALAVICALVFNVLTGGGRRQLGRDVLASLIGFGAGQLVGSALGSTLIQVGPLQVLWGIAGSATLLLLRRLAWPTEPAR
jgi:hypothetical protein